jgi:hypothetical protein
MRMLLVLGALICAVVLVPAVASAAPTGTIEGVVTGADTQEGIEGVEVCAFSQEEEGEEEEWSSCENTGHDGAYAIEEVPAGEYEIDFSADGTGYVDEVYPYPVVVGSGSTAGIDIELSRGGTVEGTVVRSVDEAPVAELEVCAQDLEGEETVGCVRTGPDGTYSLVVPPGEWLIEFWPEGTGQNLALQYFDQRARWSEADAVSVEEGETVEGVDARLDVGATITGRVTSAIGSGLEGVLVCAIDTLTEDLAVCVDTYGGGDYEMRFLPASEYKVAFSLDRNDWYGVESFEDADEFPTQFWSNQTTLDASNVIQLAAGQVVSGVDARLESAAPTGGGGGGPVTVNVPPGDKATASSSSSAKASVPPPKGCRKGRKRKRIHGKVRCVRPKRHQHRHHRRGRLVPRLLAALGG